MLSPPNTQPVLIAILAAVVKCGEGLGDDIGTVTFVVGVGL